MSYSDYLTKTAHKILEAKYSILSKKRPSASSYSLFPEFWVSYLFNLIYFYLRISKLIMFSFLFQKNYLLVFTLCYILFVTFDHLFSIPSKDTDIECKEDYNTKNSFNISSCCVTNCPTKEFFNWSFKSWVSNQLSWSYPFREGSREIGRASCRERV